MTYLRIRYISDEILIESPFSCTEIIMLSLKSLIQWKYFMQPNALSRSIWSFKFFPVHNNVNPSYIIIPIYLTSGSIVAKRLAFVKVSRLKWIYHSEVWFISFRFNCCQEAGNCSEQEFCYNFTARIRKTTIGDIPQWNHWMKVKFHQKNAFGSQIELKFGSFLVLRKVRS